MQLLIRTCQSAMAHSGKCPHKLWFWHWSESPVKSDLVGEQSQVHFLSILAHLRLKISIHIDLIASNGGVTTFFSQECASVWQFYVRTEDYCIRKSHSDTFSLFFISFIYIQYLLIYPFGSTIMLLQSFPEAREFWGYDIPARATNDRDYHDSCHTNWKCLLPQSR